MGGLGEVSIPHTYTQRSIYSVVQPNWMRHRDGNRNWGPAAVVSNKLPTHRVSKGSTDSYTLSLLTNLPIPSKRDIGAMDPVVRPEEFGAVKMDLTNLRWQYRGEGNSHMVISLPKERKVIRLTKSTKTDPVNDLNNWERLQMNFIFISSVMRPLIGPMYVSPPSLIYLSASDVGLLNQTVSSVRPASRKNKGLSFCGGELHDDHAFLPPDISMFCNSKSVCVELKPKQGFFPHNEGLLQNCTFCCKQELKLRDGAVSERSYYCPLDLFSGCRSRMENAVMSLLRTPQNNFRIFYDGHLTYGDGNSVDILQKVLDEWLPSVPGSDPVKRFSSIVLEALLTKINGPSESNRNFAATFVFDHPPQFDSNSTDKGKHTFPTMTIGPCNFDKHDLPEGSILHRLAQAQALDMWGTTEIHKMLLENKRSPTLERGNKVDDKSMDVNYINSIMQKRHCSKLNPIELYLIASAVRDCSILICFQELKETNLEVPGFGQVVDSSSKLHYIFRITVVDIAPKPVSCIESHLRRNASILDACHAAVA